MTATTQLPSIRNRALLVSLTFNKPQMTKLDKKATADAEIANNAHGALKTNKLLYPKHLVDPIVQHEAAVRSYLRSVTTPWGNTGMYLLDTSLFMGFADRMAKYEIERKQLVTIFAQNWANVMTQAQEQQGDLFDPSVYPDVTDVVAQFQMHLAYLPVGDYAPKLFDAVEKELRDTITAEVERSTKNMLTEVVRAPLTRLLESVLHIYDKTSRADTRIHETLIEELDAITTLMPSLNMLGIPLLDTLAAQCQERLSVHTESLKEKDGDVRARVAAEAKGILMSTGIDPVTSQKLLPAERKQVAQNAANNIMATMKGFF